MTKLKRIKASLGFARTPHAALVARLMNGERVGWQDLQRGGVTLYRTRAEKFRLPVDEFPQHPGLFRWNLEYDGLSNVLDVYVNYLRNKLEENGPRVIHTLRGRGYFLGDESAI